jgi:hypothetical protein
MDLNRQPGSSIDLATTETSSNEPKSRFREDFEKIQSLNKGAFGQVYEARKKIERQYYAVKCIQLNACDKEISMREVNVRSPS